MPRVFDENGNDVEETEVEETEGDPAAEVVDENPAEEGGEAAAAKYRIGNKEFATFEEAEKYATSQINALETEVQVTDAYRQGIRDAITQQNPAQSVTPPAAAPEEEVDVQLFSNPKEFLANFAKKIKQETREEIDTAAAQAAQAKRIWAEFSNRHPDLADFQPEVELLAQQNMEALRAVNATKGNEAGYDFIAMKMRTRLQQYKAAGKPQTQLKNGGGGATPPGTGTGVTPKTPAKKPLSFSEQIRQHRAKRRGA